MNQTDIDEILSDFGLKEKPNTFKKLLRDIKSHYEHKFYWPIRNFFLPQHQELRRVIPDHWTDLDVIIENFLFECVISFVEKENGIDIDIWGKDGVPEQVRLKIEEIYKYAINRTWDMVETNRDQETEYLIEIIKLRGYFWT